MPFCYISLRLRLTSKTANIVSLHAKIYVYLPSPHTHFVLTYSMHIVVLLCHYQVYAPLTRISRTLCEWWGGGDGEGYMVHHRVRRKTHHVYINVRRRVVCALNSSSSSSENCWPRVLTYICELRVWHYAELLTHIHIHTHSSSRHTLHECVMRL